MNLMKNFVLLLCLIQISSCAKVKITDREFCADMGREGASCFTTLTGTQRTISLSEWRDERFGMVCSSTETFREWKSAILKLCNMSKRCRYSTKKKIKSFGKNIEEIEIKVNESGI